MIKEKNGLYIIKSLIQASNLHERCMSRLKSKPEVNKKLENDLKKLNKIYRNIEKENQENIQEGLIVLQALQMCEAMENKYFYQIF